MRAKPYATIASGSSSVKSWASTRWPNRFGKSSWMSRIIKLIWPRLSAKKCRMSAVRGGRHQRSELANTCAPQKPLQSETEREWCKFWGDSAPVSYTHLRAHETRHDLVCRLLLEK